ncbi:MAG: hypothetical protein JSC188_000061 [Candidatus Tokpelaia sp. JSC188]|nr:MAG: hypothetical protein JSC188_000061 [Candidatus Tokpelaia sp. JSC188]
MNWFIVNIIVTGCSTLSLVVLLISLRKAAETIRFGRELSYQIKLVTLNLDQAISLFRDEHKNFRNESYKLDARIKETVCIRHDIDRSLAHIKQMHDQLQQNFNRSSGSTNIVSKIPRYDKNGFPVFVQRKISKTVLNSGC